MVLRLLGNEEDSEGEGLCHPNLSGEPEGLGPEPVEAEPAGLRIGRRERLVEEALART